MPHIVGKDIKKIKYPIYNEGYSFLFEVCNNNTCLIACEFNNNLFFIQVKKQDDLNYIIKGEKTTRPSPVSILQNALYLYSKLCLIDIIKSNIKYQKFEISQSIKEISFFTNLIKNNKNKKFELEIGFGSGRYILDLAKNNPDIIYIGLEIYKPSLDQVSKLIELNGLENIFLCDYDARSFIKNLPLKSLNTIYVHFPIPWDKKPSRRIFSEDFIHSVNRVLCENGSLNLRTDSIKYYEFVLHLFEKMKLKITHLINQKISTISKYEDRWLKMKKNIYDVKYEKQEDNFLISGENEFIFDKISKYPVLLDIENKYIKKDYGFVKFKRIYSKDKKTVISLLYGNEYLYENRFIYINDINISYFPDIPTKHSLNYKLHKIINQMVGH
jgi:tRNA (guanine-N7-)-methyltransferase